VKNKKEFNLKDKRKELLKELKANKPVSIPLIFQYIKTQDKEFIRLLKEEFPLEPKNKPKFDALDIRFSIDKLAGDLK